MEDKSAVVPEVPWRDKGAYAGDREKYKALFYGVVRICTEKTWGIR